MNARDKALELVENGMVTAEDMLDTNELSERFMDEDFDCDDGDDGYALASAGFGTDEDYGGYDYE